jgi:hypothetical protein
MSSSWRRSSPAPAEEPTPPPAGAMASHPPSRSPLPGATIPASNIITLALLEELAHNAADEQGHGFLSALGRRIGAAHPLNRPTTLQALETQANAVWATLGWGRARLLAGPGGIRISHYDWPANIIGDHQGLWPPAFPTVLAAVYHAWFQALNEPSDLVTLVSSHNRQVIELRHGPR